MNQKAYWLGWQIVLPGSAKRIRELVKKFGSPGAAWRVGSKDLEALGGFAPNVVEELIQRRKAVDPFAELEKLQKAGIKYIISDENTYPEQLKNIFDPPPGLFMRGNMIPGDNVAVAMVGSRKPTPYGIAVAEKLAAEMGRAGITVVSGLARGIDTAAHRGALKVGGRTVAVLGCGVDVVYPRENKRIQEQIVDAGAVVSEFPPGARPEAWHFPVRNRIISGLSRCVVVVEAAEKSGALITTDFALEQGRDVLAVPGNISNPLSRGPNRLIKQGARLVEGPQDILDEMGVTSLFGGGDAPNVLEPPQINDHERFILNLLSQEPVALDSIIEKVGLASQQVLAALMFLEVKGLVRQHPGKYYTACN